VNQASTSLIFQQIKTHNHQTEENIYCVDVPANQKAQPSYGTTKSLCAVVRNKDLSTSQLPSLGKQKEACVTV